MAGGGEISDERLQRDLVAVLIGASRFPKSTAIDNDHLALAFARSKRDVHRHLSSFCSEVLDRFDSKLPPADLCEEIEDFLRDRPAATDLLVYYIGHGGFLSDQSYFLSLRETATDREETTGLRASDLTNTLNRCFRNKRTYMILDCCFAGAVLPLLQGPLEELINQSVKGVALLNASSKSRAAVVPLGATRTMFSDCFCDVLTSGLPGHRPFLSLREIRAGVVERITQKYPDETKAWPEVHTPRQSHGDVADVPLFPNAWRTTSLTGAFKPAPPYSNHEEASPDPVLAGPEGLTPSTPEVVEAGRAALRAVPVTSEAILPGTVPAPEASFESAAHGRRVSLPAAVALFVCAFALTSLLAIFGTIVSGSNLLYWPAFVVVSIATVYFRWWGVALAVLSPIPMNLLLYDASVYVGAPINAFQVGLVFAAFKLFKIDPALGSWRDRIRYIVFGAALPSAVTAALYWYACTDRKDALWVVTAKWTVENVLPAAVPGVWLFGLIAESYKPFTWRRGRRPASWMRRSFTASAPWLLCLLCIGIMFLLVVLDARIAPRVAQQSSADRWADFKDTFTHLHFLGWMSLGLSMCMLCAVGLAIKQSRQSWALSEAIRRYLPNRQLSEFVMSGMAAPTENRLVTVLCSEICDFAEMSRDWSPGALVTWLNDYFARMCRLCERYGGSIDKFVGDKMMVIFGLESRDDGCALDAIRCAFEMVDELSVSNVGLNRTDASCRIGIGVASGPVVAGEIGAPERRQYTVIGEPVSAAVWLQSGASKLDREMYRLLLSEDVVRRAGLLARSDREKLLRPVSAAGPGSMGTLAYAVPRGAAQRVRSALSDLAAHGERAEGST